MQSTAKLLPYARTVDAKPNDVSIVKPGELVDVVEMNPLTLVDRRIYNLLLANAWDHILEDKKHEIPIRSLQSIDSAHKGTERLESSILRLMSTIVEVRRLRNGEWDTCRVQLLGANSVPDKKDGIVRYRFDAELRDVIAESTVFARLQRTIMFKLSSKYSLALYEIVQKRCNLNRNFEDFTLVQLRKFLGVPDNKLTSWINFKNKAITPALADVSELSDFEVEIEPIKLKAKIVGVRLIWNKKTGGDPAQLNAPETLASLQESVAPSGPVDVFSAPTLSSRLIIRTDTREKAKKLIPGYDIYHVEAEWKHWVNDTGKEAPASPDGAFIAFCKTYAKNNPL